MRRKITEELLAWKRESNGKYAALIVGTRRVGKSYVVEQFAQENYKSYLVIDFTKASDEIKDLFNHQADDFDTFLLCSRLFTTKLSIRGIRLLSSTKFKPSRAPGN